jgi:hypothetical protein
MIARRLLATAATSCLAGFVCGGGAFAADLPPAPDVHVDISGSPLPAVSGLNAKVDAFGGAYNEGGIAGGGIAVSIPLGFRYGTQIDGLAASLDDELLLSISDHLFWRDPSRGLLGLYGSYAHYEGFGGIDEWRIAAEAELYWDHFTLRGIAGIEGGDADRQVTPAGIANYEIDTRFYDKVDAAFYPVPDLQLFVGHRYIGGIHALGLGGEYLWRSDGGTATATFAEGRIGQEGNHAVWAGLRFYFGREEKSLMRRHREDDPALWEPDTHLGTSHPLADTPAIPVL